MTINWQKFFSGGNSKCYTTYYKSEINGICVEKKTSTRDLPMFSIGNMDEAKKIYRSETDLINDCKELLKMQTT